MPKNPHADFTPTLAGYSGITPFRFWCQTALPLTYDDSLSYYELLNKVVNYLNHTIEDLTNVENNTSELAEAYDKLQKYVNDYFDDIDIEAELRNVLDGMAEDGTLDALLDPLVAERLPGVVELQIGDAVAGQIDNAVAGQIGNTVAEQLPASVEDQLPGVVDEKINGVVAEQIDGAVAGQIDESVADQLPPVVAEAIPSKVTDWLDENVDPTGSAVMVDSSLTISGAAADAKVTGDELSDLKTQLEDNLAVDVISIAGLENGNINTSGENRESTTRLRTIDKIAVKAGHFVDVICGENQTYIIGIYNGSAYTTYGWYTTNMRIKMENDCEVRFLIRYTVEAEITPADNRCILQIFPPMWEKLQAMAEDASIRVDTIIDAITPIFEKGQISNGIGIDATDHARTVNFIPVTENTIFHFNAYYKRAKFTIYYYSNTNENDYITGSQDYFATSDLYLQSEYSGYVKIRYWFQPLTTINADDLTSIGEAIKIISPTGVLDKIAKETKTTTETIKVNCESGTILSGYPAENVNYCRADNFYPVNKGDIIHFNSLSTLLRITIQEYANTQSSSQIFATNNIDIPANGNGYDYTVANYGYIKFRATYIPSTAMTQDDISLISTVASYITSISQRKAVSDAKPEAEYFIKTVSHRGYHTAPENTIIAYKLAKINGFKYVETDVRFTADGVAVLLHDDTINRTARNADGTDVSSTINISDITYAQALTYDFGLYKGADYAGTKIPLFSDFIVLCRNIGLIPFIELKAGTAEQIAELYNVVRAHALHRDCWWTSGTGALLNYIIAVDDMANISYSPNPFVLANILNFKTGKNKVIAELNTSIITDEVAEQCAENEIELMEWPINIDDTILNSNPYVSWYLTNKPMAGKVLYINTI